MEHVANFSTEQAPAFWQMIVATSTACSPAMPAFM